MRINLQCCSIKFQALAVFLLLFAGKTFSQTTILVTYYSGTNQYFTVTASGKLYFDNGNLQVVNTEGNTPTSIPTSIIQKITFSSIVLPVHLLEFSLRNENASVVLYWKTENEVSSSHFVIERSIDGSSFDAIGQVTALNTTTVNNYSFSDLSPKSGISYYRLKQVDIDGRYVYSNVLLVTRTANTNITLFPNPATDYFSITSSASTTLDVKIYSIQGQLMIAGSYSSGQQISISKLMPGMYMVLIDNKPYKLIRQ